MTHVEAPAAPHALTLWADGRQVATLGYAPLDDRWSLDYAPDWVKVPASFPLSPALPIEPPADGYAAGAVKRFVENLLPEGRALDITATTYKVSKSNIYALISALGTETTGAFRFLQPGEVQPAVAATPPREVTREELNKRLDERDDIPLAVWDGKVRMSIAGVQDKLMVYVDRALDDGGRLYLVEPPLASTHILKPEPEPEPGRPVTPHLVVNEHFCMSLAHRMKLPVADVAIYRTPRPVLVVRRFDREVVQDDQGVKVRRLHIIDACQASDLPATYKYERNLGSGEHVRNVREGVSFEVLFDRVGQTVNKAAARLTLLRWALFQFLIGNCDAHGKNFSFFVRREGLEPAPWYDLVSVAQYPGIDHELAMAWGDAFKLEEVAAFQLADFARRCGVDRRLLQREASRLAKLTTTHAPAQALMPDYVDDGERAFAEQLRDFVLGQAVRLTKLASDAVKIKDEYL
ncbi:HipA domain-containing protein [Piscinibacter gummiphilus]|uniref:Phosphatidylinositol kinase n=1 Tax=Piscinibacter gummiphilus TaxID=946333 RepID=A0A1W6LGD4_9BURK|nr:HipA domain-containing protein [Piscinibacter gummiphilus]ARN23283.1 phosphatidylinositol kinase [Piscinibacter gummiphilus]ATU67984.1 type II toxin-antitoxin system HipA family toxin [Piscinibacter gummiphilus]GLS97277.1 serine/threonine-protein kinase HipA [Piscinibacter gummiphilus]